MTPRDRASRRERASWCLFDFANSAFNTLVVTFVYAAFFQRVLVGDEGRGDVLWGRALALSGLMVAVASPWLGAIADARRGRKKRFLVTSSLVTIAATVALAWPAPGADGVVAESTVWLALALFVVANASFELAFVFYNAFLPELGDEREVGRLSGRAWALGYLGGLLCLAIGLGFVGGAGYGPWLSTEGSFNVRATNLLVAGWFLLFALPMFWFVPDRGGRVGNTSGSPRTGWAEVRNTLREMRHYPDLLRLLIARLFYNDAVIAVIGLAALYMDRTLGMPIGDIMIVAVWLNVVAGLGAFGFGWLDDLVGAKAAIFWSLLLLIAGVVVAIAFPTREAFWVAATLVGLGLGPNQSASRSLLARFVPGDRNAEFFGLFALSGKATAWIGPLLFSVAVDFTGSQRVGLTPLIGMLVIGLVLMLSIDEQRGRQRAKVPE